MHKFKIVLYGLNQPPKMWYHHINKGFCKNQADHSLYVKQINKDLLVKILDVEILNILASYVIQLKWLKSKPNKKIKMKNLEYH